MSLPLTVGDCVLQLVVSYGKQHFNSWFSALMQQHQVQTPLVARSQYVLRQEPQTCYHDPANSKDDQGAPSSAAPTSSGCPRPAAARPRSGNPTGAEPGRQGPGSPGCWKESRPSQRSAPPPSTHLFERRLFRRARAGVADRSQKRKMVPRNLTSHLYIPGPSSSGGRHTPRRKPQSCRRRCRLRCLGHHRQDPVADL